jgi:sugar lactone lactonase YvrE
LVFGPDDNLYVSGQYTGAVLRYDGVTGNFIDRFAFSGGLNGPFGLIFGPNGNLYVASSETDKILRYDGVSGAFIDTFASGGGLDFPTDIIFTPEPATILLLGLGSLTLLRKCRM